MPTEAAAQLSISLIRQRFGLNFQLLPGDELPSWNKNGDLVQFETPATFSTNRKTGRAGIRRGFSPRRASHSLPRAVQPSSATVQLLISTN